MSVGAVNKQTGERIPTAGMPPIDSVLSGTSTNPVQNKVVKEALDEKQDTLTFDDTPTDGSNNPVKSNGIYDSEKDIYAAMGEMGAKNLIPYPYLDTTKTVNGITFTDNGDGTITTNGTAVDTANFIIANEFAFKENERYMLTGCPSGGDSNTYRQYINTYGGDTGKGRKFTPTSESGLSKQILIQVFSGTTLSNATFKPMLRLASDTDNKWQPYAKTNKQLTDDVALLESGKTDTDMVAAAFNSGTSYTAGNYCIYEGKFYKFKDNHTGAWAAADVDEIKIAGELSALKSGLTNVDTVTVTTNHQSITISTVYAKKLGKILLVSGYFYVASGQDIPKDTLLFTVGQSTLSDVFTSLVSSDGDATRLKMATNGEVYSEYTFKADRFYSFEMVAFTN